MSDGTGQVPTLEVGPGQVGVGQVNAASGLRQVWRVIAVIIRTPAPPAQFRGGHPQPPAGRQTWWTTQVTPWKARYPR